MLISRPCCSAFACCQMLVIGAICLARTSGAVAAQDNSADHANPLGQRIYEQRCAGCHGLQGDGVGPAARYVYPPPRNLLGGRFSLVSSSNRVASPADILRVLRDGMPGTSMKSFDDLPDVELQAVVDEVIRLRTVGLRQSYLELCEQTGEEPVEQECRQYVAQRGTPTEPLRVPSFGAADKQSIERGKRLFVQQGCASCHGPDGIGAVDVVLRDEQGNELRARDLAGEPLKGGRSNASIYLRIRLGFPSGPMPAHSGLTERQLVDLVHYVQSISRTPKRFLSSHQLRRYATRGLYVHDFGRTVPPGP